MVPVFKNVAKRSRAKNHCSVNLLYVVSEIFEKHSNDRLLYHLKKCGSLFSDFQYSFRSS